MNVVFLDFDGVINFKEFLFRAERKDPPSKVEQQGAQDLVKATESPNYTLASAMFDLRSIDPTRVQLVQQLLVETGAKVVISSSWRHGQSIQGLRALLGFHGLDPSLVIDTTPTRVTTPEGLQHPLRGHEIQAWLDRHPEVKSFVILDDDTDMAHLMDRLVRTSNDTGITKENVLDAVRVMTGVSTGA